MGFATIRRSALAACVAGLATVFLVCVPSYAATPASTTVFGTLVTSGGTAATEASAGIRNGMMELDWSKYEPRPGVFDATYVAQERKWLSQLKAAGMEVTLGLGLHYTPAWVRSIPDSRYVNQYGQSSSDINFVFNQTVRDQAAVYIAHVGRDLGISNFSAIRLTSGGNAEMLYPSGGSYWAFDAGAQNGRQMPSTMARNPFPGWRPGTKGLTSTQADTWLGWYVSALDNVTAWQMQTLSGLGFSGVYQVVTPGSGVRPDGVAYIDQHELPDGVAGVGAVWDRFYAGLPQKARVVVYVSSVADGSGSNDSCNSADAHVALSSPSADSWSATRWLSRIADSYGMAKGGENPDHSAGSGASSYYANSSSAGMMAAAVRQAISCRFVSFYWAHDYGVWHGAASLSGYAANIATARRLSRL
jgi:hypothetical protein